MTGSIKKRNVMSCISDTRLVFTLFLCVVLPFVSCSHKRDAASADKTATLMDKAVLLEGAIKWSAPVHGSFGEVQQPVRKFPPANFAGNPLAVTLWAENIFSGSEQDVPAYPYLPGFANLDISSYTEAQRACVQGFCTAIENNTSADGFMLSGYVYALVLFKYNVGQFGKRIADIESHILGQPFITGDVCQCPVRFVFKDKSHLDAFLYLVKSSADWKIHQIELKGATDGRQ